MFGILLALAGQGQAVPPNAPAAVAPVTNQQRFDSASAAAAEGRCKEAIAAFSELEATPAYKGNALLASAVDVRKGECLIRVGRLAEGAAAIGRGMPALEARGQAFAVDVRSSRLALGDAAAQRLDYDDAARWFQLSADKATGTDRIVPLMRLSQITIF